MDHGRFRDEYDGTYGFAIRKGVTNRFAQLGIRGSFGTIEGEKYTFLGPTASYRIFRHLDISVGSAIQNLGGVNQQHIVTTSYELSPTSSIGGRLVVRNGQSNGTDRATGTSPIARLEQRARNCMSCSAIPTRPSSRASSP